MRKKRKFQPKSVSFANDSKFLTTVPSEYVTDEELTGKGYATNAGVDGKLTSYAKKTELPTAITTVEIDGIFGV